MRKVFALFRNPASYIDPLLYKFSQKVNVFVAFSVNKPHEKTSLDGFDHVFLERAFEEKFREGKDYELLQKDIKKYMAREKYDIVFIATSYWSPTTWIAIHEANRRNLPIMTRMTAVVDQKRSFLTQFIKKIIVTAYCREMEAAVYECEEQKNYLLKYGMKEEQLFFAPCAVNNAYFSAQKNKYDKVIVRKELNLDDDMLAVIFVGQLIKRKRPMDIINAVKHLRNENKKVKLIILGDGFLRNDIEKYIQDNKLCETIILCGKVNHETMSMYLSACDVYVLPSEFDPSPKALNEAMNFQLPIIISDGIKTAKEMCEVGENGYVYKVGDVNELIEYLRILLDNKNLIDNMGRRSREIVSKYNFDAVTDAWVNAIEYGIRRKELENG